MRVSRQAARVCLGWLIAAALIGCADAGADDRAAWLQQTLVDDNRDVLHRAPELVAAKFALMASGPYPFFRGTAAQFLRDMAVPGAGVAPTPFGAPELLDVVVLGDPHPENLGTFRLADGSFTIGFNDFDAATFGPFQHDVRRLALGWWVAAESAADAGAPGPDPAEAAEAALRGYVDGLAELDAGGAIEVGESDGAVCARLVRKARQDGGVREELDEYTRLTEGGRTMFFGQVEDPLGDIVLDEVHPVANDEARTIAQLLDAGLLWASSGTDPGALLGASRRFGAGVGSYALYRYYVLTAGPTGDPDDDVLLELKEIRDPFATAGLPPVVTQPWSSNPERAVALQQVAFGGRETDPWLGWGCAGRSCFRVRERTKYQRGFDVVRMIEELDDADYAADDVVDFAWHAGRLLARLHAESPNARGFAPRERLVAHVASRGDEFVATMSRLANEDATRLREDLAVLRRLLDEVGPTLGFRPHEAPR